MPTRRGTVASPAKSTFSTAKRTSSLQSSLDTTTAADLNRQQDWDWEVPISTSAPRLVTATISSNRDVAYGAEFSAPYDNADTSASRRHLKRKSIAETTIGAKRASVVNMDSDNDDLQMSLSAEVRDAMHEQEILPAKKIFTIQLGDRIFRLSGASLSSDAPSYFTKFFGDQLRQQDSLTSIKSLHIDRDPATFEDIVLHLQGYHVEPRDGAHFVKLFADAQYFNLPRLTSQLFSSTIHIRVGNEEFHIPRELFSKPGDSPNFFTLGFSTFFTGPTDIYRGMQQDTLVRPPAVVPPSVPGRSADIFADLLNILKGYEVEVRNQNHRADLLRDARYFHLKGLEQKLIPHAITYSLVRQKSEIVIRLEDIRKEGLSLLGNSGQITPSPATSGVSSSSGSSLPAWVTYQRPYIDQEAHILILEIGGEESATLMLLPGAPLDVRFGNLTLHGEPLGTMSRLFNVIACRSSAGAMGPPSLVTADSRSKAGSVPASPSSNNVEDTIKVTIGPDADVMINGKQWNISQSDDDGDRVEVDPLRAATRRVSSTSNETKPAVEFVLGRSQWRVVVQANSTRGQGRADIDIVLSAVKIDGYSHERARNIARNFLT